jgi:outer membrane autotransporter protein
MTAIPPSDSAASLTSLHLCPETEPDGRRQSVIPTGQTCSAVAGENLRALTAVFAALAFCALLLTAIFSGPAMSSSAEDYRTPEYLGGRGLDAVNAAEAYALGYSGKGVTVGVIDDSSYREHLEFIAKLMNNQYSEENFIMPEDEPEWHGVHVTGTIAASRGNGDMHGVAYDAGIVSMMALGESIFPGNVKSTTVIALEKFLTDEYRHVSIISNSWGAPIDLSADQSQDFFLADYFKWHEEESAAFELLSPAIPMAKLAASGTLIVFAGGNEGVSSPGNPSFLPSVITGARTIGAIIPASNDNIVNNFEVYDDDLSPDELYALSLSFINVSAFDPCSVSALDHCAYDDGVAKSTARLDFIAPFTNMADGAAHYTLLAPGVQIYSSVGPPGKNDYAQMSGTSMAVPHVSGVAALVKEAFPWMDGKRLADTLLSTATPLDSLDKLPPLIIQAPDEFNHYVLSVTIPQSSDPDADPLSSLLAGHGQELLRLKEIFTEVWDGRYADYSLEEFIKFIGNVMDIAAPNADPGELFYNGNPAFPIPVHIVTDDQYISLFGMGIVNAGEAVRGPGWLDANRLSDDDVWNTYAMYGVDTTGFDSVWSHDIKEVRVGVVDAKYPNGVTVPDPHLFNSTLSDLPVGLHKLGAGTLTLTGSNTYAGATRISEGEIALGTAGRPDGEARLAGDVIVESDGTFSGNGYVGGSLLSGGTIVPGFTESPGAVLTVRNDIEIYCGKLLFAFGTRGNSGMLEAENGIVRINGTTLELSGMKGGGMPASFYEVIRANAITDFNPVSTTVTTRQGVTMLHSFDFVPDGNTVMAMYVSTEIMPQAKALSEGFLAGTVLVSQGSDLAAGQGMREAENAARGAGGGTGLGAFFAISGGMSRYDSGSHVDMSGMSLMIGLALGHEIESGHLTAGAFFEYGSGSYDTYNSFANAGSVHGDGDIYHAGGGILGRLDFSGNGHGRFYGDVSFRAGRLHNKYFNGDLVDPWGLPARYDSSASYYGFHAGAGYVWNISDSVSLDTFAKYFFTRQGGDTVALSTGDIVKFEDADSSRLRLGGRFSYAVNVHVSPYVSFALEHEFIGEARACTNGFAITAPSLRGNTGIGELGLALNPSETLPLTFDIGVQGYVGKRRGMTGSMQIRFPF